jgi:hypothetical protein
VRTSRSELAYPVTFASGKLRVTGDVKIEARYPTQFVSKLSRTFNEGHSDYHDSRLHRPTIALRVEKQNHALVAVAAKALEAEAETAAATTSILIFFDMSPVSCSGDRFRSYLHGS